MIVSVKPARYAFGLMDHKATAHMAIVSKAGHMERLENEGDETLVAWHQSSIEHYERLSRERTGMFFEELKRLIDLGHKPYSRGDGFIFMDPPVTISERSL